MAIPSSTLYPMTGYPLIDALTNGTYWILDPSRTLTWGLANFGNQIWADPNSAAAGISSAFTSFSRYANIRFQYTGLYNSPNQPGIDQIFSIDGTGTFFANAGEWAEAFFPNVQLTSLLLPASVRGQYSSAPGDIWLNLNSAVNTQQSLVPGSGGYAVILHEIAHSLGMKHPHDSGGTGRPTFADIGGDILDVDWLTIMSYNESNPLTSLQWHPATPMILDVIALQYLYGPNLLQNAGNDAHTLLANNVYQTIFDPSGSDVLNVGGATSGWTIQLDLLEANANLPYSIGVAEPTSTLATPSSLYWLYGTFEGVIATNFADNISGSTTSERFIGSGGNDVIDGGGGRDTSAYNSLRSGYTIMRKANGFTVNDKTGREGMDLLNNMETLAFADTNLSIEYNDAVQALYVAYFGRPADTGGIANFQAQLAALNAPHDVQGLSAWYGTNATVHALIDSFGASQESRNLYTGDTRSFVSSVYNYVLNRGPDTAGLDFWTSAIDRGGLSKGNAALSIMAGALTNTTGQGRVDAALVTNKLAAASNFTFALDTAARSAGYNGDIAAATARTMLASVSGTTNLDVFQSTVESTVQSLAGAVRQAAPLPEDTVQHVQIEVVGVVMPSVLEMA
jgi:serralysin